jgi:VWFA-related protein
MRNIECHFQGQTPIVRSTLIVFFRLVILAIVGILVFQPGSSAQAQSATQEPPTLKDFGSSIKRLKWDPIKQAAVETGSAAEKRQGAPTEDVIRINTQLVVCTVQVRDRRGRAVPGLTQNDFLVTEDEQRQQIGHFTLGDDLNTARSIVLIIDYSASQLNYIETSVEAAKTLVDKLGPKDRMVIVTDDVALLVDFSSDKAELKKALKSLRDSVLHGHMGRSAQFTALLASVRELVDEEDIRPIIIFQTDGDEVSFLQPPDPRALKPALPANSSPQLRQGLEGVLRSKVKEFSLNDVYTATEKSRATVYTVIPGIRFMGLSPGEQLERARLKESEVRLVFGTSPQEPLKPLSNGELASLVEFRVGQQSAAAGVATVTGGWTAFLEEPKQAQEIYDRILSDVNSRYVIGYYPINKVRDGKRRKVLIEVRNHPEYTVEGRKSYYAPEQ